jgi:hypothetical protein
VRKEPFQEGPVFIGQRATDEAATRLAMIAELLEQPFQHGD